MKKQMLGIAIMLFGLTISQASPMSGGSIPYIAGLIVSFFWTACRRV